MSNGMKRLAVSAAIVVLAAGRAYGQDAPAAPAAAGTVSLADAAARTRVDADLRKAQDPDEKSTWDDIKRGFYAGLVMGGIVGVVMVAECGHPECGPLLTLAAGVGGAIGLGIDALFDRESDPVRRTSVSAHGAARRPTPATGPRVMLRFRKSW